MHGSSLTYAWLSDGTKVLARTDDGSGNGVQKRYLGSFVYTSIGGSSTEPPVEIESIAWDEGRIFFNFSEVVDSMGVVDTPVGEEAVIDSLIVVDTAAVAGWFRDCWYAADHLGNVRAVIDINPELVLPEILEQNDYLPYGTRIQNSAFATATDNRWRYAGKEEQRFAFGSAAGSLNLSLLDFGARMYDPFVARWTAVDPLASSSLSFTPFVYCGNNSVNNIDPHGMDWYEDEQQNFFWRESHDSQYTDENGKIWNNIGEELLFFTGKALHYFTQIESSDGDLALQVQSFSAVSGRGDDGFFDLSRDHQGDINYGPIPEGRYYISPREVQHFKDLSLAQKMGSIIGKGPFPKGRVAWGDDRVWIKPERVIVQDPTGNGFVSRGGFSIHGGLTPGSAGCIDLHKNAPLFFNKLKQSRSNQIILYVRY